MRDYIKTLSDEDLVKAFAGAGIYLGELNYSKPELLQDIAIMEEEILRRMKGGD